MRILVDARCLLNKKKTGVEFYVEGVLKELVQVLREGDELELAVNEKGSLMETQDRLPRPAKGCGMTNFRGVRGFHSLLFSLWSRLKRADVVLFPTTVLAPFCGGKRVIFVYDLTSVVHPEFFSKKELRENQRHALAGIARAEGIVTISESTKQDILKFYRVPERRIVVAPCALAADASIDVPLDLSLRERFGIPRPFLLFVGAHQRRKNLSNCVRAFIRLNQKPAVPGSGPLFGDRIRVLPYVSERDKYQIYRHAELLMFPSYYEGFGIPILEGFACGTPVLTSALASMPEVAGSAAVYVDPSNVEEIALKVQSVLEDTALRTRLVAAGRERLKERSYTRSAAIVYKFLQRIHNGE